MSNTIKMNTIKAFAILYIPLFFTALFSQPAQKPALFYPGTPYTEIISQLQQRGGAIEEHDIHTAQTYAKMLLASTFLAKLNNLKAKHKLLKLNKDDEIAFIQYNESNHQYLLGFSHGRLEALYLKSSIKVDKETGADKNPHTVERLHTIHQYFNYFKQICSIKPAHPEKSNHFLYKGTCGQSHISVHYNPGDDLFTVMLYKQ